MKYMSQDMSTHRFFEEDSVSDSEDTLSLCDLSFTDNNQQDMLLNSSPVEEDEDLDSFRFSDNPNPTTLSPIDSLLFFGKSVPYSKPSRFQYTKGEDQEQQHERSRIALFRSDSFNKAFSSCRHDGVKTERFMADYCGRSSSLRLAKKGEPSSAPIGNSRKDFSSCSKKYKAFVGVTKFPAKMELNEIRRRQSRMPAAPLFPATSKGNNIGTKSLWGLVRPMRSRSHLLSALARTSFGCIQRV